MRPEKKAIINQIRGEVEDAVFVILTDYRGLNVERMEQLRSKLSETQANLRVVKNKMFQQVCKALDWEEREESMLGPSALIVGSGDIVEASRILKNFVKENELPVVKTGILKGKALSAADIAMLADLPTRPVLLGTFLGTLSAPMTQLVGVCQQKVASLVYVLKAIEDKKQNS